ncbi:hypothetical protein E2P81_ATG05303 [Venturia nashicola]|uniref:Uncharacterized protein n=1 Tax=Venturia nashicola TaxID=86259 RepID=A0A4Z1PGE1_9PEZI|nr:hypothetical protein E6O75_ATG05438 [Venturia nashicola]TLD32327.1 hypothetical protein E2P81_ATG05303 [Venturia nashicola]
MVRLRRHNSPTGVSAYAKNNKVDFAHSLVTGISRPVNNEEHWILYYFEAHAAQCRACEHPLQVSRSGRQLCNKGHQLATDVAELIFRHKDGKVYSHVKDCEQEVRVEIPHGYEQTLSLLKAIQRASKKKERFLHKSHDRHYSVGSRIPTDQKTKRESRDLPRSKEETKPSPQPQFETVVVKPLSPWRPQRREFEPLPESSKDRSKRGSLYGMDMGELEKAERREQRLRYNLEVRRPTAPTSSSASKGYSTSFF